MVSSGIQLHYEDDLIALYHGDCRDFMYDAMQGGLGSALLVTDPPYGIGWKKGYNAAAGSRAHAGIVGDENTAARDEILELWGDAPAIVFGSLAAPPPAGLVQTLIWQKPPDAGVVGSVTGFRRDADAIYLCGKLPRRTVQWSSVLRSGIPSIGNPSSPAGRWGHPHAKPTDLMARLISLVPDVLVFDPFAGSGSTLAAAKLLGRRAIGVEIEEAYCKTAAQRLAQEVFDYGEAA
jgi:site-specific DNA-methyltransferase (adenine-specific)